ncbi:hypothetical protein Q5752_002441 [Cryptotrichosporon argae]
MPSRKAFYIAADSPRSSLSSSTLPHYASPPANYPPSPKLHARGSTAGAALNLPLPRPIRRPRKILYLAFVFFVLYWFGIRHGLGMERVSPPPLGFAVPGGRRGRTRTVSYDAHGMASLLPVAPGAKGRPEHPIYELMERAEERWARLLASQSTSLDAAVATYRRRYGLDPPAGFDAWYAWCAVHGVRMIDDYDLLMRDIVPHHALEPALWLERARAAEGRPWTYTLDVDRERVQVDGPAAAKDRPQAIRRLIDGFRDGLPEGFHLRITGLDHDTGSTILGEDQRARAVELVKAGQHFTQDELDRLEDPRRTPAWGWFKACPLTSPANIRPWAENATDEVERKSFISDHIPTMDFCEFPQLKRLHGAFHMDREDRSDSMLKPILVHSKMPGDRSFLLAPLEGYSNVTPSLFPPRWEDKHDARLHWRGSSTGGFNVQRDWKDSHRLRLHLMVNGPKGGDAWWNNQVREVMVPDEAGGYSIVRRWERMLSQAYADVKLSGHAVQCPTQDLCDEVTRTIEFAEHVWPKDAAKFRYILDVDGNGWSSRFHRVLSSGSPVLKMTMFADWHMSWLTPWYHYIPIKPDYSDLYDVMAFFVGPMDETGAIDTTKGHDYLARKIGEAGRQFALEHWRWEDMQAYTFRLFLELARLSSPDRQAASYREPTPA